MTRRERFARWLYERWVPSQGDLWSKQDVAAHYSVSTRTVERWAKAGLPHVTVAGRPRFTFGDVEKFLDSGPYYH